MYRLQAHLNRSLFETYTDLTNVRQTRGLSGCAVSPHPWKLEGRPARPIASFFLNSVGFETDITGNRAGPGPGEPHRGGNGSSGSFHQGPSWRLPSPPGRPSFLWAHPAPVSDSSDTMDRRIPLFRHPRLRCDAPVSPACHQPGRPVPSRGSSDACSTPQSGSRSDRGTLSAQYSASR